MQDPALLGGGDVWPTAARDAAHAADAAGACCRGFPRPIAREHAVTALPFADGQCSPRSGVGTPGVVSATMTACNREAMQRRSKRWN
jgi:hypothetical protein